MQSARDGWGRWMRLVLAGLLVVGCATRPGLDEPELRDAASPAAEAAPVERLGAALREDPPLPGTVAAGWPALDARNGDRPDAEAAEPRGVHAHHH